MFKESASTSLDLRPCQTAVKKKTSDACAASAALPFCWLCVECLPLKQNEAHGTQNEQLRLLNAPALKPKAPVRRWNLAGEYASASAIASAPIAPASPWPRACQRQPTILGRAARLHALRYFVGDQLV